MNDLPETSPRYTIVAFIIVALAIVGGGALLLATRPQPVRVTINPPVPTATPAPSATPGPIQVYVTGAVAKTGTTLSLPAGSRVKDALDAAGGTTQNADLQRVNLAGILRDGDQVNVPEVGQEVALPTAGGGDVVHVNTATVDELSALPGVGPSLAQKIIDYRTANGPFKSMDDLDQVSGVGPSLLAKWQGLVAFD